ncbi:MAG: ribonuclease HII [Verrucomicrobiia bacterium]
MAKPSDRHSVKAESDSSGLDKFVFERKYFAKGIYPVAGVDEAGRGPLAGPVVAAAVILPYEWYLNGLPGELIGLNDSKQLTPAKRELFYNYLTTSPMIKWGVAKVEPEEIDSINILNATGKAMLAAINNLSEKPSLVLIDGNPVKGIAIAQEAIVKGDSLSYSIAAASVIAKVTRDRIMIEIDKRYPGYGFAAHKGYGTREHLNALKSLGPSPIHRKSFEPVSNRQMNLFG